MTHSTQELVIREVTPVDAGEISGDRAFLRGVSALREDDDARDRGLHLRHGDAGRSVLRLPDGPAMWSTWRRAPLP